MDGNGIGWKDHFESDQVRRTLAEKVGDQGWSYFSCKSVRFVCKLGVDAVF